MCQTTIIDIFDETGGGDIAGKDIVLINSMTLNMTTSASGRNGQSA